MSRQGPALLTPFPTGMFWPHKWDLPPPPEDEPIISPRAKLAAPSNKAPGTALVRWDRGNQNNHNQAKEVTRGPIPCPYPLSSGVEPPRREPVRVTAAVLGSSHREVPTRKCGLYDLALLITSGNPGVAKWDLEKISTCFQHCLGRVLPRKEKSPSCYPARCTERKGKKGKRKD